MNKPFKCCGIIYFMDELAQTTSSLSSKTRLLIEEPNPSPPGPQKNPIYSEIQYSYFEQ